MTPENLLAMPSKGMPDIVIVALEPMSSAGTVKLRDQFHRLFKRIGELDGLEELVIRQPIAEWHSKTVRQVILLAVISCCAKVSESDGGRVENSCAAACWLNPVRLKDTSPSSWHIRL